MEIFLTEARMEFRKKMTIKQNISIICAPFGIGGPNNAAKDGPKALLSNGLGNDLKELGFNIKIVKPPKSLIALNSKKLEYGTKKGDRIKNIELVLQINEWLSETVANEIKSKYLPLTIGGDHSLGIGTVTGTRDALRDIGVLWIDRHFDAHSPKYTPSMRAHGMPTAVLTQDKNYDLHPDFQKLLATGQNKKLPKVKPQNFVHFAIGEKSLAKPKTKWYFMEDIDKYGINRVTDEAISYLLKRVKYIYVAWDIDSMNVTGTGTSGDSQLTLREGLVIARAINKKIRQVGRLAGLEIMEIAPRLERKDLKGQTVDWATQLVTTCFGDNLFNNLSRMTRNINMHAQ